MPAMIIKNRARRPLVAGRIDSVGLAPHGVGAITDFQGRTSIPVVIIQIGDYRFCIPKEEFEEVVSKVNGLEQELPYHAR